MKTKLDVGQIFQMGRINCTIMSSAKFGNTAHYGFTWFTDEGKSMQGWMPCHFVENFTGILGNAFDSKSTLPVS